MKIDEVPSYMRYWGKALKNEDGSDGFGYHLFAYHCLDVAAVAEVWLESSNTLMRQISGHLKCDDARARSICLFFILLHDLGKLDARFQQFREDIRLALQGDEWELDEHDEYYSHGSYGYLHFAKLLGSNEAMKAVAGHHGYCDTSIAYFEPEADDEILELDALARKQWIEFCLAFCGLDSVPDVGEIPLLAGLCSVADWVGSSITNFNKDPNGNLTDYYKEGLVRAKAALTETGMIEPLQGAGFAYLFEPYSPRGIQTLLGSIPVNPGLVLAEADTGSGKTEFALAYASSLIEAGFADGVVFALPTQATANGLFERIGDAANKLFPDASTTLAHGKSKYIVSDESGFLHQSNKRAFLGSVSVATIDQILMGVLAVRHQFVRAFGTRKSVLVIDEAHSFDAYMTGLVEQVLKGQHQSFASVILLSATMPKPLKDTLLDCYGGYSESKAYPLVTHTDFDGTTKEFTLSNAPKNLKNIDLITWRSESLLPNSEQQAQITEWLSQGAMIAIICNTVADAQKLYHEFNQQSLEQPVDLFHARYTFYDRDKKEREVLKHYGKKAARSGRLLIATQVVEQSLDLDFDVMISQIAPIEFLMQRMGRLWRHDRIDTELHARSNAISKPLFITLIPCTQPSESHNIDQIKTHYQGSGFVYQNIRTLYRTEQYLSKSTSLSFPNCYREAIDFVHEPEPYAGEPERLTKIAQDFGIKAQGSNYAARCISKMKSTPLNDVDPRCAMLTREGEMSQSVLLLNSDGSLLHGGDIKEQKDRENSTVSIPQKHVKGQKDETLFCYKAHVGRDIEYGPLGIIYEDLKAQLN